MKKTYFDDDNYCERTIEVEENAILVLKQLNLFKKIQISHLLKRLIRKNDCFLRAFLLDIKPETIERYFSDLVAPILKNILKQQKIQFMSYTDPIVFYCDFLMPIAYKRTVLEEDQFEYECILIESPILWQSIPKDLQHKFYSLSYNTQYHEVSLPQEKQLEHSIQQYPELSKILTPSANISWNYNTLIDLRQSLPKKIYAYCIRRLYTIQTKDVPTELLQKAFAEVSKDDLMYEDEQKKYQELPDIICVFRGTDAAETVPRLSWSLNPDVAKKFSNGQVVMKAIIAKTRILAYFNDHNEEEVLVWVTSEEVERL